MLKDIAENLQGAHHDIGKFAVHLADRMIIKEQELVQKIAQARIDNIGQEYTHDYMVGYRDALVMVREVLIEVLTETVDDINHKGDKHHEKHFKDGIE